jgi:hypothetical protein
MMSRFSRTFSVAWLTFCAAVIAQPAADIG